MSTLVSIAERNRRKMSPDIRESGVLVPISQDVKRPVSCFAQNLKNLLTLYARCYLSRYSSQKAEPKTLF